MAFQTDFRDNLFFEITLTPPKAAGTVLLGIVDPIALRGLLPKEKTSAVAGAYPIQSDKAALRRQFFRRSRLYSRLQNEKPARAATRSRLISRLTAAQAHCRCGTGVYCCAFHITTSRP